MGKWDQYAEQPKAPSKNKWEQYAEVTPPPKPAAPAPKVEPGWFEPGSKSEALVRGLSQGATLGFGDEIQALIRSVGSDRTYAQLRDEERAANADAASKNTGSYMAGNIVGSLPGAGAVTGVRALSAGKALAANLPGKVGLAGVAKRGAALGAAQGLGSAEGTAEEQLGSTALGGTIGAALPTGMLGAARAVRGGAAAAAGSNLTNTATKTVMAADEKRRRDALGGAIVGGVGSLTGGGSFVEGAALGGMAGYAGAPVTAIGKQGANLIRGAANAGGRSAAATSLVLTQALQNLSGQQKRTAISSAESEIQRAVAAGQPEYAATFTALQKPVVRTAVMEGESQGLDDDEDEVPEEDDEDTTDE